MKTTKDARVITFAQNDTVVGQSPIPLNDNNYTPIELCPQGIINDNNMKELNVKSFVRDYEETQSYADWILDVSSQSNDNKLNIYSKTISQLLDKLHFGKLAYLKGFNLPESFVYNELSSQVSAFAPKPHSSLVINNLLNNVEREDLKFKIRYSHVLATLLRFVRLMPTSSREASVVSFAALISAVQALIPYQKVEAISWFVRLLQDLLASNLRYKLEFTESVRRNEELSLVFMLAQVDSFENQGIVENATNLFNMPTKATDAFNGLTDMASSFTDTSNNINSTLKTVKDSLASKFGSNGTFVSDTINSVLGVTLSSAAAAVVSLIGFCAFAYLIVTKLSWKRTLSVLSLVAAPFFSVTSFKTAASAVFIDWLLEKGSGAVAAVSAKLPITEMFMQGTDEPVVSGSDSKYLAKSHALNSILDTIRAERTHVFDKEETVEPTVLPQFDPTLEERAPVANIFAAILSCVLFTKDSRTDRTRVFYDICRSFSAYNLVGKSIGSILTFLVTILPPTIRNYTIGKLGLFSLTTKDPVLKSLIVDLKSYELAIAAKRNIFASKAVCKAFLTAMDAMKTQLENPYRAGAPNMYLSLANQVYSKLMIHVPKASEALTGLSGRPTPVGVHFSGASGIGKSLMVQVLAARLYDHIDDIKDIMFAKGQEAYFSGYTGQPICVFDDPDAVAEIHRVYNADAELITLISGTSATLNLAACEDKGMQFVSEIVIVTTNETMNTKKKTLKHQPAYYNRFEENAYEVVISDDFVVRSTNGKIVMNKAKRDSLTPAQASRFPQFSFIYRGTSSFIHGTKLNFDAVIAQIQLSKASRLASYNAMSEMIRYIHSSAKSDVDNLSPSFVVPTANEMAQVSVNVGNPNPATPLPASGAGTRDEWSSQSDVSSWKTHLRGKRKGGTMRLEGIDDSFETFNPNPEINNVVDYNLRAESIDRESLLLAKQHLDKLALIYPGVTFEIDDYRGFVLVLEHLFLTSQSKMFDGMDYDSFTHLFSPLVYRTLIGSYPEIPVLHVDGKPQFDYVSVVLGVPVTNWKTTKLDYIMSWFKKRSPWLALLIAGVTSAAIITLTRLVTLFSDGEELHGAPSSSTTKNEMSNYKKSNVTPSHRKKHTNSKNLQKNFRSTAKYFKGISAKGFKNASEFDAPDFDLEDEYDIHSDPAFLKLAANLCRFYIDDIPRGTATVAGRGFLTFPCHFLHASNGSRMPEGVPIKLCFTDFSSVTHPVIFKLDWSQIIHKVSSDKKVADRCMINLPNLLNLPILKCFANDYEDWDRIHSLSLAYNRPTFYVGVDEDHDIQTYEVTDFASHAARNIVGGLDYHLDKPTHYASEWGKNKDCGGWVCTKDNGLLVAMSSHRMGNPKQKTGMGLTYTVQDFREFTGCDGFNTNDNPGTRFRDDLGLSNQSFIEEDVKYTEENDTIVPKFKYIERVAIVHPEYRIHAPGKSKYRLTPWNGTIMPFAARVMERPFFSSNDPRAEGVHPLVFQLNIRDLPRTAQSMDRLIPGFKMLLGQYSGVFTKYSFAPRKLTLYEAVNGVERGTHKIEHTDFSKSEGYPMMLKRPRGMSGKRWLFNFQDDKAICGPYLRSRVDKLLDAYRTGVTPLVIFAGNLKDEPIKIGKKKIRMFSASPLDYQLVALMYFKDVMDFLCDKCEETPLAMGMNMFSSSYETYCMRMLKNGGLGFEVDLKSMDATMTAELMEFVGELLVKLYELHDPDWQPIDSVVRRAIIKSTSHHVLLVLGVLLQFHGCMPSGTLLTSFLEANSMAIVSRSCWYEVVPKDWKLSYEYFVSDCFLGDDSIFTCHEDFLEWFNGLALARFAADFQLTLTDGDKLPISKRVDTPFMKMSFLSITPRHVPTAIPGRTYMPVLRDQSIIKQLNWTTSLNPDQLVTNVNTALRFIWFRGEKIYREVYRNVAKVLCLKHYSSFVPRLLCYEICEMMMLGDEEVPSMTTCFYNIVDLIEDDVLEEDFVEDLQLEGTSQCDGTGWNLESDLGTDITPTTPVDSVISLTVPTDQGSGLEEEHSWSVSDQVEREQFITRIDWPLGVGGSTVLWMGVAPWILPARITQSAFNRFTYVRTSVKLKALVQATSFHQGLLILYFIPLIRSTDFRFEHIRKHRASMMVNPYVFIDPTSSNEAELIIEPRHWKAYLNKELKDTTDFYGTFVLEVFNSLQTGETTTEGANISLYVSYLDSHFAIPDIGDMELQGTTISKSTNVHLDNVTGATLGNVTSEDEFSPKTVTEMDMAVDAAVAVGGSKSIKGDGTKKPQGKGAPKKIRRNKKTQMNKNDKPTIGLAPQNVMQRPFYYLNHCQNVEQTNVMSYVPGECKEVTAQSVGTDRDEMCDTFLLHKPTFDKTFFWTNANTHGDIIWGEHLCPLEWTFNAMVGDTYNPTLMDYVTSRHTYWRGSLVYIFQVVCSDIHKGVLSICINYGKSTDVLGLPEASSQYVHNFALTSENRTLRVEVPWRCPREMLLVPNGVPVKYENHSLGRITARVSLGLRTMESISNSVSINVFKCGGPDYEVMLPGDTNASFGWQVQSDIQPELAEVAPVATGTPLTTPAPSTPLFCNSIKDECKRYFQCAVLNKGESNVDIELPNQLFPATTSSKFSKGITGLIGWYGPIYRAFKGSMKFMVYAEGRDSSNTLITNFTARPTSTFISTNINHTKSVVPVDIYPLDAPGTNFEVPYRSINAFTLLGDKQWAEVDALESFCGRVTFATEKPLEDDVHIYASFGDQTRFLMPILVPTISILAKLGPDTYGGTPITVPQKLTVMSAANGVTAHAPLHLDTYAQGVRCNSTLSSVRELPGSGVVIFDLDLRQLSIAALQDLGYAVTYDNRITYDGSASKVMFLESYLFIPPRKFKVGSTGTRLFSDEAVMKQSNFDPSIDTAYGPIDPDTGFYRAINSVVDIEPVSVDGNNMDLTVISIRRDETTPITNVMGGTVGGYISISGKDGAVIEFTQTTPPVTYRTRTVGVAV